MCPHAACGKPFSVNSNMRRHFRTHFVGTPDEDGDDGEEEEEDDGELVPTDAEEESAYGGRSSQSWAPSSQSEDGESESGSEVGSEDVEDAQR